MELYGRKPLEPGTELEFNIVDPDDGSIAGKRVFLISDLVASGGSSLVYKGEMREVSGASSSSSNVLIKEFYPFAGGFSVHREGLYLEPDKPEYAEKFENAKKTFRTGHDVVNDYYRTECKKDIYLAQELNNTLYTISLYGKGNVLKGIDRSTLNLETISRIMYSLSKNLFAVHKMGYLYLDCKPENIFCEENSGAVFNAEKGTSISLFDFDTAISLSAAKFRAYKTLSGSRGWAAPEQIIVKGKHGDQYAEPEKINEKTDIFSAGLVFYWLLTGTKLEFGINEHTELDRVVNGVFEWADENIRNENTRTLIIKILKNSLAWDNDDRAYDTFYEMMVDFAVLAELSEGKNHDRQSIYAELNRLHSGQSQLMEKIIEHFEKFLQKESVTENQKKYMDSRNAEKIRVVNYQDLLDAGMSAIDIANRLVENDYALYPQQTIENEGTPEQWAQYLSSYPETFRYLINSDNEIIGNWSFLAVSEEHHLDKLRSGELEEQSFVIDETEFLLFPGDYVGYLLNLSLNDGYNSSKNINMLFSSFADQLLSFANEGIFFRSWYVNVFRADHEAMYKKMGFHYLLNNKTYGKIYELQCNHIENKSFLSMNKELKGIYDEHFA